MQEERVIFATVFVGLVIAILYFASSLGKKSYKLPPYAAPSALEVLKSRAAQVGLDRVQFIFKCSLQHQNLTYGSIFRLRVIPFLITEQIVVTDYKLARIILLGDKDSNFPEGVKKKVFQTMNLVHREINNIFT